MFAYTKPARHLARCFCVAAVTKRAASPAQLPQGSPSPTVELSPLAGADPTPSAHARRYARNLDGYDFSGQSLVDRDFSGCSLRRANFQGCDLTRAVFSRCDLYRADFRSATLYVAVFEGADLTRADFHGAHMFGMKMTNVELNRFTFDHIIVDEISAITEEDYIRAAEVYAMLKRTQAQAGWQELANEYQRRQRICQRKARRNNYVRTIDFIFGELLTGYGERPQRLFYWAVSTIITFAVLYVLCGQLLGPKHCVTYYDDCHKLLSQPGEYIWVSSLLNMVYYSGRSFTTSCPGNMTPYGFAALLTAIETVIGPLLLAILIATFARNTMEK